MAQRPALITRSFLLLILGHLLQALGYSSMLLLPLYLDYLGANRAQIGTLMALSAVGGLASRPLAGWALDAWGRKPTVLVGTLVLVLAMGLMAFVRTLGPLIYLDRVLLGAGSGTLFTAYFTWASDMIPEERRTEGIALFGISGLVPLALNPLVKELGVAAPDLRLLFPVLGGVIALSLVCFLLLPEPEKHAHAPEDGRGVWGVLGSLGRRPLWPVWLATCVFAGLVGVFMAFATVTAGNRGLGNPAGVWLTYACGAIGVRLVGARLPDRVGPANLVAPALALYLLACVLLTSAIDARTFLLAGLLAGLGHGYCFPVLISQVVTRSPARWRGSAIAAFTAAWQLSELVLPPLFGFVADRRGDGFMYGLAAVTALGGLLVWTALEHGLGEEETQRRRDAEAQ